MRNKPIRLAFSGMKGSGKDHCLKILYNDFVCTHYSFSDQLKNLAINLFPHIPLLLDCPPEDKEKIIYTNPQTGEGFSHRDIWTKLNALVEIDPDILVRGVREEFQQDREVFTGCCEMDYMVVKDLRPHNPSELGFCMNNGFQIIYIENGANPIQEVSKLHVTEKGYDHIRDNHAVATFKNNKEGDEPFREFLRQLLTKGMIK